MEKRGTIPQQMVIFVWSLEKKEKKGTAQGKNKVRRAIQLSSEGAAGLRTTSGSSNSVIDME